MAHEAFNCKWFSTYSAPDDGDDDILEEDEQEPNEHHRPRLYVAVSGSGRADEQNGSYIAQAKAGRGLFVDEVAQAGHLLHKARKQCVATCLQ